jgi:hypothetical protein
MKKQSFAFFVLYRDVRMPRAQDAQERPSVRLVLILQLI